MEKCKHEFGAFYDSDSEILILGSFPSVKSRECGFYYMHPQNRFWEVLYTIYGKKDEFIKIKEQSLDIEKLIEIRKKFLKNNKIALFDVFKEVEIKGSSDSSIKNYKLNDITQIIKNSKIKKIYTNGRLSDKKYQKFIYEKTKIEGIYLPSTSSANGRFNISQLLSKWAVIRQK